MFYSVGIFRTSSPGDTISSDTERIPPGRRGDEQSLQKVSIKGRDSEHLKYFCELKPNVKKKKKQMFQVEELGAFLCRGVDAGLTAVIPFTSTKILYFHTLSFLGAHKRWLQMLMTVPPFVY